MRGRRGWLTTAMHDLRNICWHLHLEIAEYQQHAKYMSNKCGKIDYVRPLKTRRVVNQIKWNYLKTMQIHARRNDSHKRCKIDSYKRRTNDSHNRRQSCIFYMLQLRQFAVRRNFLDFRYFRVAMPGAKSGDDGRLIPPSIERMSVCPGRRETRGFPSQDRTATHNSAWRDIRKHPDRRYRPQRAPTQYATSRTKSQHKKRKVHATF